MSDSYLYYQHRRTGEYYWWSPREGVYRGFNAGAIVYPNEADQLSPLPATPDHVPRTTGNASHPTNPTSSDVYSSPPRNIDYRYARRASESQSGYPATYSPSGSVPSSQPLPSTLPTLSYRYGTALNPQAANNQPTITGLERSFASVSLAPRPPAQYTIQAPSTSGTGGSVPPHSSRETGPGPASGSKSGKGKVVHDNSQRHEERLDPSFNRKPAKFFRRHRVFKVWWHEPGGNAHNQTVSSQTKWTELKDEDLPDGLTLDEKFKEKVYSKIRWFISIREGADKCICVPIVTYRGQGVAKFGVIKSEHCIAYTHGTSPAMTQNEAPVDGERGMRPPVCIRPDDPEDRLEPMSRIDYSRTYTVEHNVKAKAFGWVHKDSELRFAYSFKNVFFGIEDDDDSDASSSGKDEDDSDSDGNETEVPRNPDSQRKGKAPAIPFSRSAAPSSSSAAMPPQAFVQAQHGYHQTADQQQVYQQAVDPRSAYSRRAEYQQRQHDPELQDRREQRPDRPQPRTNEGRGHRTEDSTSRRSKNKKGSKKRKG